MDRLLLLLLFLYCPFLPANTTVSKTDTIMLDMRGVDVYEALTTLGKAMHQNIIIRPEIHGKVFLSLHNLKSYDAFQLILQSQNLVKTDFGEVWLIETRNKALQNLKENIKERQIKEDTSFLNTEIWQLRYAKAEEVLPILLGSNHSLFSKRGCVKIDKRTNIIYLEDTPSRLLQLKKFLKELDKPIPQLLIEARLVSLDQDCEQELGIGFNINDTTAHTAGHYSLAIAHLANGSELDIRLAALESEGKGEIISSPSLVTGNQQSALIESGEQIPYQEMSESGGTSVAFKKAVLSLKVTPQLLPNEKVFLQLQVNQDRPNTRVVLGVPSITTRQIMTNLTVKNGQTIVLGGIYETNAEQATQRIPFLGKIPFVGWLFKQRNVKNNKRELLIFVTPKII